MRIGLISDTHGYLDDGILNTLKSCDEVWHAGDVGSLKVIETLESIKPCKGVHGNIDDHLVRAEWPKEQIFMIDGLKVYMTHIGGYPPKYKTNTRKVIEELKPDLFICGHSHILKIMPDKIHGLIHMNPGACGHHGFHVIRTMIRFTAEAGKISDVEVLEFGRRGKL